MHHAWKPTKNVNTSRPGSRELLFSPLRPQAPQGRRSAQEKPPPAAVAPPAPQGARGTHVSRHSGPGCPGACGWGRWWRSGYRCRSCWPGCSWGGEGSEAAGRGDLPSRPPPALLLTSGGRGDPNPTTLRETGGKQSPSGPGSSDPLMKRGSSFTGRGRPGQPGPLRWACALAHPRSAVGQQHGGGPWTQGQEARTASAPARDPPVEEGGEQPPQQDFVLHARTQVAVHELAACDVDPGACDRQTEAVTHDPRPTTFPGPRGPEQVRPGPGAAGKQGAAPGHPNSSSSAPPGAWDPTGWGHRSRRPSLCRGPVTCRSALSHRPELCPQVALPASRASPACLLASPSLPQNESPSGRGGRWDPGGQPAQHMRGEGAARHGQGCAQRADTALFIRQSLASPGRPAGPGSGEARAQRGQSPPRAWGGLCQTRLCSRGKERTHVSLSVPNSGEDDTKGTCVGPSGRPPSPSGLPWGPAITSRTEPWEERQGRGRVEGRYADVRTCSTPGGPGWRPHRGVGSVLSDRASMKAPVRPSPVCRGSRPTAERSSGPHRLGAPLLKGLRKGLGSLGARPPDV